MSILVPFWALLALAFVAYRLKQKKMFRFFVITALFGLFIFSFSPLPSWLIYNLENEYPVLKGRPNTKQLPVLVLGGGHTNDPRLEPVQRLSPQALSRLTEGMRQYRLSPGSKLILSGYSVSGNMSVSETMALSALSLGINAKDTLMLTKPSTTWEEAQAYKKRFGTSGELILVTSASHMPRAMETFRRAGLKPIAAPTFHQIRSGSETMPFPWKFSPNKFNYADIAIHEYFGMLYYRWFKE